MAVSPPDHSPLFTAVIPLHNVEHYVGDFLASLLHAGAKADRVELIFIDDGSTDHTWAIVHEWVAVHYPAATLLRTPNGGVSAARNLGLSLATAPWVTFPDPDDLLGLGYFDCFTALIEREADDPPELLAANIQRVFDPDPTWRDVHALRSRFLRGTRVADIDREAEVFQMSVATAVFPTDALRASGARFIDRLHASEDALFIAHYLLGRQTRRIGLVAEALYGYRRRATGGSAVDSYRGDPASYLDRFRDGYLPLLQEASSVAEVPDWLQTMLLYECQWLFPQQLAPHSFASALGTEQRREVRDTLGACLAHVSDRRLLAYDVTALPLETRLVILALTGRPLWHWISPYASSPDRDGIVSTHLYGNWSEVPAVGTELDDGLPTSHAVTIRFPDYFDQKVMSELIVRTRGAPRAVIVDGQRREVRATRHGESIAQCGDRHRREHTGAHAWVIPPAQGAVRVWKYIPKREFPDARPWCRETAAILGAWLRRCTHSLARTLIGLAPRPQGWAIDAAIGETAARLRMHLARHLGRPALLVHQRGFSLGRVRARYWIFPPQCSAPVVRGYRVAVHHGEIERVDVVGIDACGADLVIADSWNAVELLRERSRFFPEDILYLEPEHIVTRMPAAVTRWERERRRSARASSSIWPAGATREARAGA